MLPDKIVRKRLNKSPRKVTPKNICTSAERLSKKMISPRDYEWVEMRIIGVGGSDNDWSAIITSEDENASISVEINPMHASYIICSLKELNGMMMHPTPYQVIENLATTMRMSTNCAIIETSQDDLLSGKIEMSIPGGRTLYHGLSAADAITFAATTSKPLYMLRGLVNRLTD